MYQNARQTNDDEIRRLRLLIEHYTSDNAPSVEISVTLPDKEYWLRFVGKHWFDLKTILGSWDGLNAVKPVVRDA